MEERNTNSSPETQKQKISKKLMISITAIGLAIAVLISCLCVFLLRKPENDPPRQKLPAINFNPVTPEGEKPTDDPAFEPEWEDNYLPQLPQDEEKPDAKPNEDPVPAPEQKPDPIKPEYLSKYPAKKPPITVDQLAETGVTQNRWLSLPYSRVVLNPFPGDTYTNAKYSTNKQQVLYSNRSSLPINIGYLTPNATDEQGLYLPDSLLMYAGNEALMPAERYSTKWTQYANYFQAQYKNGLRLEGKDFFYDENTVIRTVHFSGVADNQRYFSIAGKYVGAPAATGDGITFKSSSVDYALTMNGTNLSFCFFADEEKLLTGEKIKGEPGREGYFRTIIDLKALQGKPLVIAIRFANGTENAKEALKTAKNIMKTDVSAICSKRAALWNNFLAAVPQPIDFSLSAVKQTNGLKPEDVKAQYYKAWMFLAADILPENTELYHDYPQFACGKPSLWGHGDQAKAPYSATWESLEAMQMFSLVDPQVALDSFTGMMTLVNMETGLIIGESLPAIRAETAMILYKNSGNLEFLAKNYEAIKKCLEWSMKYPSWLFGNGNDTSSRDADFSFAVLNDISHIKEIARLLGMTQEVMLWSNRYEAYLQECFRWHWESPASLPNQFSKVDEKGNVVWRNPESLDIVLSAGLMLDGLSGARLDSVKRVFERSFRPDEFNSGMIHNKYPNQRMIYYGLIKQGMFSQAEKLIDASLRDNVSAYGFGEVLAITGKGEIYASGVRPSVFSCAAVIDSVLLKNGFSNYSALPTAVNLNRTKNIGVKNICIGGKKIDLLRNASADKFSTADIRFVSCGEKQYCAAPVDVTGIKDLHLKANETATLSIGASDKNAKFYVTSDCSDVAGATLKNGKLIISAQKDGMAVITVTVFAPGHSAATVKICVRVGDKEQKIQLNQFSDVNMETGDAVCRQFEAYPPGGRFSVTVSGNAVSAHMEGNRLWVEAGALPAGADSAAATVTVRYEKEEYRVAATDFKVNVSRPTAYIETIPAVSVTEGTENVLQCDIYPFDVKAQIAVENTAIADIKTIVQDGRTRLLLQAKKAGKTFAEITVSKNGYKSKSIRFPVYVYEAGVTWKADFSDLTQWTIGYSDNPGGSELTCLDGNKGVMKSTDKASPVWQPFRTYFIDVDLEQKPLVCIDTASISGGNWSLKMIVDSGEEIVLIPDNNETGKKYVDLSRYTSKSGKQKIQLLVYVVGKGASLTLNELKIYDGRDLGIAPQDDVFIEQNTSKNVTLNVLNPNVSFVAESDNQNVTVSMNPDNTLKVTAKSACTALVSVYPVGQKDTLCETFRVHVLPEYTGFQLIMDSENGWQALGSKPIEPFFYNNKVALKSNGKGETEGWGQYIKKPILNLDLTVYDKLVVEVDDATCLWDIALNFAGAQKEYRFFERQTGSMQKATGRYVFDITKTGVDLAAEKDFSVSIITQGFGMVKVKNISLVRSADIETVLTSRLTTNSSFSTELKGVPTGATVHAASSDNALLRATVKDNKLLLNTFGKTGTAEVTITISVNGKQSTVVLRYVVTSSASDHPNVLEEMPMEPDEYWNAEGDAVPKVEFKNQKIVLTGGNSWGVYVKQGAPFDPDQYRYLELVIDEYHETDWADWKGIDIKLTSNQGTLDRLMIKAKAAGTYRVDLSKLSAQHKEDIRQHGLKLAVYTVNTVQATISRFRIIREIETDGDVLAQMPKKTDARWCTGGQNKPTVNFLSDGVSLEGTPNGWGNYSTKIGCFDPNEFRHLRVELAETTANNGSIEFKLTTLGDTPKVDKVILKMQSDGKYHFDLGTLTAEEQLAIQTYGMDFGLYVIGDAKAKIVGMSISRT